MQSNTHVKMATMSAKNIKGNNFSKFKDQIFKFMEKIVISDFFSAYCRFHKISKLVFFKRYLNP